MGDRELSLPLASLLGVVEVKNADEPLVASRLTRIYDVVVLATLVLIGAEVATWFIHVPAVVWLIRTLRILFVLLLASVLYFVIRKKEAVIDAAAKKHASVEQQLHLQAAALEAAANAIVITDCSGKILWVNRAFSELTGYTLEEALGNNPRILKSWEHDQTFYRTLWSTIQSGEVWHGEIRNRKKDGTLYTEEMTIAPVLTGGQITNFVGIKQDVTEKKKLEAQYRQAQKMEAVGRLAGGVAHDFNNVLSVIVGYTQLSVDHLDADHAVVRNLTRIKSAAERAASLTKQLLAFSRQQVAYPTVVDLNKLLQQLADMLQRLVGDDVQIVLKLSDALGNVVVDASQFEQVLMNLAVNARDAMPEGGQITIETRNEQLDESYHRQQEAVRPGDYVMLSFSDTGCGMDEQTKARIFEPFYTTKEAGRGTGLGLSTVYGIVKQNQGYIWVYSEAQKGTTLKVYLPLVSEPADAISVPALTKQSKRGDGQTILLVEDDSAVRELVRHTLENANYKVLEAPTPQAALEFMEGRKGEIQLVLTDIMMPKMSGVQVATSAKASDPNLKVLFMSGYSSEMVNRYAPALQAKEYIEKPFTKDALLGKIADLLLE